MAANGEIRIFLAHASEDKPKVQELYRRLKARGFTPWLDKEDLLPGQMWRDEIAKAVRRSDYFIACFSQNSVEKQSYVQREFRLALNQYAEKAPGTIYLIPLRLDECRSPNLRNEQLGLDLNDIHYVDYWEEDGFERLVKPLTFGREDPNPSLQSSIENVEELSSSFQSFTEDLGDGVNLEIVTIPGGSFVMGSSKTEEGSYGDERPQHRVEVPPFYLGKYPVTQAQWKAVAVLPKVERNLDLEPSYFHGGDRCPVEQVSWDDAVEFCARLSRETGREYRLPSEAEWEYACRAGTQKRFHFGDEITPELANFDGNVGKTTPVGRYQPNGFGLCDMHGNVWEWCRDRWHENYLNAPADSTAWESGDSEGRVRRGGSWDGDPRWCRSAYRGGSKPGVRYFSFGFRVACAAPRT